MVVCKKKKKKHVKYVAKCALKIKAAKYVSFCWG